MIALAYVKPILIKIKKEFKKQVDVLKVQALPTLYWVKFAAKFHQRTQPLRYISNSSGHLNSKTCILDMINQQVLSQKWHCVILRKFMALNDGQIEEHVMSMLNKYEIMLIIYSISTIENIWNC